MFRLDDEESQVEMLPIIAVDSGEERKKRFLERKEVGILPVKNTVLFPGVVLPIAMNREKSIKLVTQAYKNNREIGVVAQRHNNVEDPGAEDLYQTGTLAKILKIIKLNDGATTVVIQGISRFCIKKILESSPYFYASIVHLKDTGNMQREQFQALISSLREQAERIIHLSPSIPTEAALFLKNIESPLFLMHFIAGNIMQGVAEKQAILETDNLLNRAKLLLRGLQKELQFAELKNKVVNKTKSELDRQQKEYFLQQQLKSIREELGGGEDTTDRDLKEMRKKAAKKKWSKEVQEVFDRGMHRLEQMSVNRVDYSVEYTYLEWLLHLPWNEFSKDSYDVEKAERILNKGHFGMKKIKERILEHISILSLRGDMQAPILCFAGPPGIGKTSLARSVAEALGRKFAKISLGGLHDESEIRGHRKTYIGAMPGRIIQSLKKVQVANPVMLLDEIDKVGKDYRGDASSALLEVLDPEQNKTFYDNYLEVEYDLSNVLFITTANDVHAIQAPLRDRLEVIDLSGYVTEEKIRIAQQYLLPKQLKRHGLQPRSLTLNESLLRHLIEFYTRESGVRELERLLAKIIRYIACGYVVKKKAVPRLHAKDLEQILGKEKYNVERYRETKNPGVAVGLAWTPVGGDILFIETLKSPAPKDELRITGNLGNVMKESAVIALSYLRAHAEDYGIKSGDLDKQMVHIHVPEGAIPKDGPSAGITLLTALFSAYTDRKVKRSLAMTGEITLRGDLLPVGGIKEKVLAAKRAGMKEILMSKENEKDVKEIEAAYLKGLHFHYVQNVQEALQIALPRVGKTKT